MIDLHCHVLPGVDDGPATVEAALDLARGARADGITTIAATPHVESSYPGIDSARIRASVRELQQRLDAARIDVRIVPGAEVAPTRAVELGDAELRALTLGGGPWLLLECPLAATGAPGFTGVARSLVRRGHRLLLAHPERSPIFLRTPSLIDELVAEGMLAQVTAGALSGRYGRSVRDLALGLVERETVHVVASDGHGSHRPARIAGELRDTGIGPALTDWLARDAPAALLAGTALPPRPQVARRARRKRLLQLFDR
ncbi:MAG TPA: CpsB/CapC family capsule biosynthesis tyrosine phosphatase [Conexibacter sp.]|jgi:protein-tyrosine phosphatase|nr:CpsB/CapC family capsule biosynthesis tyrosine phosphatase [Conexibacter sp.]